MARRVEDGARRLADGTPPLSDAARALRDRAVDRIPLSGRGRARVARVAQTAAALAGAGEVAPEHLAEALSYRAPAELEAAT